MSKLLQGRLPFAPSVEAVDGNTFNKAVRLLEISLDAFNPDSTPQFNISERDKLKFNAGDIIWNTSTSFLQLFTGNEWLNISTQAESGSDFLKATGQVGEVQVINKGAIVVSVG